MGHLEQMASLGLGSRLKRLSDYLMNQGKLIYQEAGIDFDPRWFPLFSLLSKGNPVSITEAAADLKLSHPQIIKLSKELEKRSLVNSKENPSDARSRVLVLSDEGEKMLEEVTPLWAQIQKAIEGIYPELNVNFLDVVQKLEVQFEECSFSKRVCKIKKKSEKSQQQVVSVVPYHGNEGELPHFVRLNREWVETYFEVEPCDESFFADPVAKVIEPGGEIFFAKLGAQVVGTVAMFKDRGRFELSKMAVDPHFRGYGIGSYLMESALDFARMEKVEQVYLLTNSKLLPAIRLYEKFGFESKPLPERVPYERGDVYMEWKSTDL